VLTRLTFVFTGSVVHAVAQTPQWPEPDDGLTPGEPFIQTAGTGQHLSTEARGRAKKVIFETR
jgi:hypothetical protein